MPCGPTSPWRPCGPTGPMSPLGPTAPVGPATPAGPASPFAPWGPTAPIGPIGPATPCGPTSPCRPCGPWGPIGPTGPATPARPWGPAGPAGPRKSLQLASEQTASVKAVSPRSHERPGRSTRRSPPPRSTHTVIVPAAPAAVAPPTTAIAVSRASTRRRFEVLIEVLPRRSCDGTHSRERIDAYETAPGTSSTHSGKFQMDCGVARLLPVATCAVVRRAHIASPVRTAPALWTPRPSGADPAPQRPHPPRHPLLLAAPAAGQREGGRPCPAGPRRAGTSSARAEHLDHGRERAPRRMVAFLGREARRFHDPPQQLGRDHHLRP